MHQTCAIAFFFNFLFFSAEEWGIKEECECECDMVVS